MQTEERPLIWLGDSLDQVKNFPDSVKQEIGFALHLSQGGDRPVNAVSLVGYGSSKVQEIIAPFDGETYRVVLTVQFKEVVYVIHAFQKKSVNGKATPRRDVALITSRLKDARFHYEQNYGKKQNQKAIQRKR